jgi:hypothetical protein
MLADGSTDHALHQKYLEMEMGKVKSQNTGRKLTVEDYAEALGMNSQQGRRNIRELFERGGF